MQGRRFRAAVEFDITVKEMAAEGAGANAEHWQRQRRLLHALLNDEETLRRFVLFSLWGVISDGAYLEDEDFRGQFETHGDFFTALHPLLPQLTPEDAEAFAVAEENDVFLENVEDVIDSVAVKAVGVRLEPAAD